MTTAAEPHFFRIWERRIRTVFPLAVLGLILGTALIVAAAWFRWHMQSIRQQLHAAGQIAVVQTDAYLDDLIRKQGYLARVPALAEMPGESRMHLLTGLIRHNSAYECAAFLDASGRVTDMVNPSGVPCPVDMAGTPLFRSTVLRQEEYLGLPQPHPATGVASMEMGVPVRNGSGQVAGALMTRINLKFLSNVTEQVRAGASGYVVLLDQGGSVIARPARLPSRSDSALQTLGAPAPSPSWYRGLGNEMVLGERQLLRSAPWSVVVELPRQEVYAPVREVAFILLLVLLAVGTLVALLSLRVARRVVQPLLDLTTAAERVIRHGSEGLEPVLVKSRDEFGLLAATFNTMTSTIEARSAALQASEAMLRAIVENSTDSIFIKDAGGRYALINRAGAQFFRMPASMVLGRTDQELLGEDAGALVVAIDGEVKQGGVVTTLEETVVIDGVSRTFLSVKCPYRGDAAGAPGLIGISRDITERKRMEEALRQSQDQLSQAMRMAHTGHWEYDVDSDTFTFNDNFYRLFKTTAEKVGGYTMSSADYAKRFCHPDDAHYVAEEVRAAIQSSDPRYSRQIEHRMLYADGEVGYISVRFSIVKDSQGRTVRTLGVNQDITERMHAEEERKNLQEQLFQAQKLESVGQLAGGVAHDFNNQLMCISGYAELLQATLVGGPDAEYAGNILLAARRAADLTRQLLSFSRKNIVLSTVINVHDIIEEVVRLLGRSLDKRIVIVKQLQAQEPHVLADASQLQNALLNLAINARDAMPEGGTLTFSTSDMMLAAPSAELALEQGPYLAIEVADTGCGMSEALRQRIFEPFFTTKKKGRGTGLGLASVFGTVRSHRGSITVQSSEGEGSVFRLLLPRAAGGNSQARAQSPVTASPGRGCRVLVIDDEPQVCDVACAMLAGLGHRVVAFQDPAAALEYWGREGKGIDLVLLDMAMPGLPGEEVFARLLEARPAARVLLTSGYSAGATVQRLLAEGARGFVAKPYDMETLARQVAAALADDFDGLA